MKKLLLALTLLCFAGPALAATCKLSEYRTLARDSNGNWIPVAVEPSVARQSVTYTSSAQSAAFNSSTRFIRVVCDAKAHFRVTTAGTNAVATDPFVAADSPEYFGVTPGDVIDFYDGTT